MLIGVGEALGIAQFGMSLGKMALGDKAAEQKIYNSTYQTAYQNAINQFRVEQQNKQAAKEYEAKLGFVKNQIENNFMAAQASWTSEQMRLNTVYEQAAYKSESIRKMLTQSMGAAAAREVYGKSARRGALITNLGAAGRTRAQLVEQLMDENVATQMRMEQTTKQFKAQNKLAISQTEVLPIAATFSPAPLPGISAPSFAQQALGVAEAGLGAFQTGFGATPTGGTFFGIKKG